MSLASNPQEKIDPKHIHHEKKQLKWFLVICLVLLLLTAGTDFILSSYGKATIPAQHNPLSMPTPTPIVVMVSPTPTYSVVSPTQKLMPTKPATTAGTIKQCTMEAKLCPDGKTSVGRTGPNCTFAPCPE